MKQLELVIGDEPIEKVLSYFNDIHGINYVIKNNEIVIK